MSLPGKTMKIGGYNYHVSDQGEGDKIAMLVHGMPDDGSCWKYQAPALLKAGYRVIVPDTLGYGDIVMSEKRRLLGALEAANGVLMFAPTTGFLYTILSGLLQRYWDEQSGTCATAQESGPQ